MFTEPQRRIFSYVHKGKVVFVDPMRKLIELKLATGGRLNTYSAQHNVMRGYPPDGVSEGDTTFVPKPPAEDSEAYLTGLVARQAIADATITAFGLEPFDPVSGAGTTLEDALAVYVQFMLFINQKKSATET